MSVYQQRREELLAQLPSDSVVILIGNTEKVRNKNINYPFRQDHDFYYLTGFEEPEAVAVLRPNSDAPYILFNQPKDEFQETWFAARSGQQGAVEIHGADQAFDIANFEQILPDLLESRAHIYLSDELGLYQHKVSDWLNSQRKAAKFDEQKVFRSLHSVLPLIQNRRRIKDASELALLRQALRASNTGHQHLMSICKPGITEQEMAAEFYNQISKFGCQDVGYPTILAAGNNACCLHYDINRGTLQDGELVLVDAGGDYKYYTADITRTYPVNGKFTAEQKDVYQIVLEALDTAIATVKPGASWNSMYPAAMKVLAQGLIDLKILTQPLDQVMEQELYKPLTLHKTGHWMGMDVHDVGTYRHADGSWVDLQQDMVFTIEPGLYFPKGMKGVDERWHGMGVRVEDDILVTADGCENLSAEVPRTVADIEDFMATKMRFPV
jgi:Xaa-Pro aminopeptidase